MIVDVARHGLFDCIAPPWYNLRARPTLMKLNFA
jgi:hypothetical protein